MRTISYRLDDLKKAVINIGFVGENEHTRVRIDAGDLYAEYPSAAVSLTVQPPEGEGYPAVVERDGNVVIWDVTDSDLTAEGQGEIQLAFTEGEVVAKTYIGRICVERALVETGEIPTALDDFLTRAGAAVTAIPETINTALAEAKASGEFDGEDGYSPTATVSKSGKVATITITDKNGTTTATVSDGDSGTSADVIDDTAGAGDKDKTWSADKLVDELAEKADLTDIPDVSGFYTKPSSGIPASDIASGVIPDPTSIIDDTAGDGDTNKVWSADKSADTASSLSSAIEAKYTKPSGGIPATDIASGVIPDVSGKQNTSNLVTSLSSSSTDTQYPSAKCVYDIVGNIETLLAEI